MTSLREKLKENTAQEHRSLEAKLDIMGVDWSESLYFQLLNRFLQFHSAFEKHMLSFPDISNFYASRKKTTWLHRDIPAQNQTHEQEAAAESFLKKHADDTSSLWGMLYVIEGSTLGAQVLSRHFAKELGTSADDRGHFFAGYGERTGVMWQSMVKKLDELELTSEQQDRAVKAARSLFTFLGGHLAGSVRTGA